LKKIDLLKKVRLRFRIAPSSKVFIPLSFFCFFLSGKKENPFYYFTPSDKKKEKEFLKFSLPPL